MQYIPVGSTFLRSELIYLTFQAPSNMKAVLQAGWLFTVAVGNIIVLIVAEAAQLPDQVGAALQTRRLTERFRV